MLDTNDKGIIFQPDPTKGRECHVGADFNGRWASGEHSDPEAVLPYTGFGMSYAGFPIYWCRKLQTEICLSTTEAEYVALSMAMREVVPFLNLVGKIKKFLPVANKDLNFFLCRLGG